MSILDKIQIKITDEQVKLTTEKGVLEHAISVQQARLDEVNALLLEQIADLEEVALLKTDKP